MEDHAIGNTCIYFSKNKTKINCPREKQNTHLLEVLPPVGAGKIGDFVLYGDAVVFRYGPDVHRGG